ncbi:ROK family transcriptional regulator [Anaerolinea thermophila]|uniref:NagC family transcriptional regulator n=1 Tax=Anaerolinea thermophila (strain DSM 14523 / JCM 11388 / NBRC 100420 / UNI-1) TaxID=926569 RepID=E8N2P0_ANATU|nr:ROK family protein [Anaerolinea thermophila]BAJ62846.1 NagC family transcriptional regulator [Anaerolinea thermophila UNI-1]
MEKATHQQTKAHNRNLVLKTIFEHEAISRAEIARKTQLTRATVSELVNELLTEGIVEEVGTGASIGGKSPILLSLVPDSRFLIGVNLGQDNFIASVVNLRGEIKETIESPALRHNPDETLALVIDMLESLLQKQWKPIVGIGIGAPGLIHTRQGMVLRAVNLDWENFPLAHLLEERFHMPVSILNDSQATAIGEFVYGKHVSSGNLIVVNIRHGIGAGILINGRLFQGDGSAAGEIGHVVVNPQGDVCRCGKRGCLETIASAGAVLRRTGVASLSEALERWENGNSGMQAVVAEAGNALGEALAHLVGALNIHHIVLTGEMTRFGEPWLESVRHAMQKAAFHPLVEDTRLEIGMLDYRACILGAAAFMVLEDYDLLFLQEH